MIQQFDPNRRQRPERMKTRNARRGRKKVSALSRVLAAAGGVLMVAGVVMLINYINQANQLKAQQESLRQLYAAATQTPQPEATHHQELAALAENPPATEVPPPTLPPDRLAASDRFLPLMRRNNDLVGWLKYAMFPEIDFPVVQRDNDYYMFRGFTGESNLAGTVFLDAENSITPRDKNLVLHGHNMKNGTMFGRLQRMMEPAIFQTDPFVVFDTLYQDAVYVPYAVTLFSVNPGDSAYFNIVSTRFDSPDAMGDYVNWLRARSSLVFPTQVSEEDRLLTLVTCHGLNENERLAVALRAVRPGEDMKALAAALKEGIRRP